MPWDHIIKNGTIVTAADTFVADIYVQNGKIAAITKEALPGVAREVTDAAGKYVLPGFIDTHVHSRDGYKGAHHKEDFFHSSMAGACGGVTTIYEMPNCNPAVYDVRRMKELIECITPKAFTDFAVWGLCLGDLNMQEILPLHEAGVIGFKFFWGYAIDKSTYQLIYNYKEGMENVIPPLDQGEVYRIFREVAKTGQMVAIHAENFDIIKSLTAEVMQSGDKSYAAMLRARPPVSETTIIETAISLARELGTHLHILHLAAGDGVDIIRNAQDEGVDVTAETCPHYLYLTDADAESLGAMIKGYPPVRTQYDQDKLWEGLMDGTLSFVCSDHAPHTKEEKRLSLWEAPAGMATIETMSMVMLNAVHQGKLTLHDLVRVLSEEPARLYNTYPQKGSLLPDTDADIVIVDMDAEYVFHQENMHSRTQLSPYDNKTFKGKVSQTILRGRTIAKDGEIVGEPGGRFIKPGE
ncbi:MAG: allantoinase AllB [Christensenellaceae bacterium]|jgi:allantoinase|nr:allantoinase AllB [Christensenellaceae bacterium]